MKKFVLLCAAAALCTSLPSVASPITFSYSASGMQTYTISQSGTYQITAYGGSGGSGSVTAGGTGAIMGGTFSFIAGQVLDIYVGQQGSNTPYAGGGGGGTFVVLDATLAPLIVAGGVAEAQTPEVQTEGQPALEMQVPEEARRAPVCMVAAAAEVLQEMEAEQRMPEAELVSAL